MSNELPSLRLVGERVRDMRLRLGLSQQAFADTLQAIGLELEEPNGCTKRLVQKWERNEHRMPKASYRRALETLAGAPFQFLCESIASGDVTDTAHRFARVIAVVAELNAELFELRAYFNTESFAEVERGCRQ